MKRGLLIAGGTLGGLGAVMSITPPQFSATDSLSMAGIGAISSGTVAAAPSPSASQAASPAASTNVTAKPTQSATKAAATKAAAPTTSVKATHSATKPAANSNSNSNANTGNTATNPTPAAAATTVAPAPAGVSGTFVGPSVFVQYGNVQVQITVVNGRITDAQAIVAPTGKNDRYTNMAVPVLKKQTLAAQSSNIQGASGASYTSYGWFKSLQGALANAGL
jgi:uncharacterized protein with FMN-binding domain